MTTVVMVYLCIFVAGFIFLLFQFIFGFGDGDTDIDTDHDLSGGLMDDLEHTDVQSMSPSIFSLKVISCFLMGFGLFATISNMWINIEIAGQTKIIVDCIWGCVGGLLVGYIGWLVIKAFLSQQSSVVFSNQQFVGVKTFLRDTIQEGGIGEVGSVLNGSFRTINVKSYDGKEIKKGTFISVVSVDGNVGIVRKNEE